MSWSISKSGAKADVAAALREETFEYLTDTHEKREAEAFRDAAVVLTECASVSHVSISASGSAGAGVSMSVSRWLASTEPTSVA